MACPYYKESEQGKSIGCCNNDLGEIPSESHQKCLCLSYTGVYKDFCPVYAKFQRGEAYPHRWNVFRRIFQHS